MKINLRDGIIQVDLGKESIEFGCAIDSKERSSEENLKQRIFGIKSVSLSSIDARLIANLLNEYSDKLDEKMKKPKFKKVPT